MERLQSASKSKSQKNGNLDGQCNDAEASSGNAVVCRFLMSGKLDATRKLIGYCSPMSLNVGNMTPCQPQAKANHQGECNEKCEGEIIDHQAVTEYLFEEFGQIIWHRTQIISFGWIWK